MTAETAESKMTYLDLQAYAGVTKHMGGFEATNELLALCHIENVQQILDVGCGIGVGPAYIAKTYGYRVVGVDISETMIEWSRQRAKQRRRIPDLTLFSNNVILSTGDDSSCNVNSHSEIV